MALQATTSMAAAPSKKGVRVKLPKTYGVVVRGGITHESNANDVRDALVTHYAFDPADAMLLSTQFANGISSRRGSELMEVVATFGRDPVLWLTMGLRFALKDPKRRKQSAAKISSVRQYLLLWRRVCTILFASNSGNNLRLVEKLEHLQSPKTSAQYSSGTLPKPCWVIFDEAATPRCSEKVADFLKAVFVQVDGRQNDQKASLKICKAWMAAMLNAEVARQAKECTDPKFLPFEEGFLTFNYGEIALLTTSVSTAQRMQLVQTVDGKPADIHKHLRVHVGMGGLKFMLERLRSTDIFHCEQSRLVTAYIYLQCYFGAIRFCEVAEVRLHHYVTYKYSHIGPNEVDTLCYILDDGKQNDSGHLELVGAIEHRDPALSLFTALAELALVILRETRVDNELPRGTREWFKITDTQELMTMQLLQVSSEAAGGGINRAKNVYTTCAKRVKQLLQEYQQHASQDGDIKVTHQARVDAIQELQKAGIDMETMRHFLRKLRDEMQKSYLSPLNSKCLLQLAGFDPDCPLSAVSPHLDRTIGPSAAAHAPLTRARTHARHNALRATHRLRTCVPVADADFVFLINTLVPEIEQSRTELDALLRSPGNHDDACAVTAKGVLMTLRCIFESLFRTSAARERTASGALIRDSKTLRELKSYDLYKHPVFESPAYKNLVAQVRLREDEELAGDVATNCDLVLTPWATYRRHVSIAGRAFDIHTSPALQRLINNFADHRAEQRLFNDTILQEVRHRQGCDGSLGPAQSVRVEAAPASSSAPLSTHMALANANENGVGPMLPSTPPLASDSGRAAKRASPMCDITSAAESGSRKKVKLSLRGALQHLVAYRDGVKNGPPIKDLEKSAEYYDSKHLPQVRCKLKALHDAVKRRTTAWAEDGNTTATHLDEALVDVARLLNPGTDTYKNVSVQPLALAANKERKAIVLYILHCMGASQRNPRDMAPEECARPLQPLTADQKVLFKAFCKDLYSSDQATRLTAQKTLREHTPQHLSADSGASMS